MAFSLSTVSAIAGEFLQCTFRGVPFAVYGSSGETGRRVAQHEYPGHDGTWSEDLGRKGRRWKIRGLLVGPTCYTQRDLLSLAVERHGPGLLIHPSLGILNAVCVSYEFAERDGYINVIDLTLEFVEQTQLLSRLLTIGLHAALAVASMATRSVSAAGYTNICTKLFSHGAVVAQQARATMSDFTGTVVARVNGPSLTARVGSDVTGNNGRYYGDQGTLTPSQALDNLTQWRGSLGQAASSIASSSLSPDSLSGAAIDFIIILSGWGDPTARISTFLPLCSLSTDLLSPLPQQAVTVSEAQHLTIPWTRFFLSCLTLGPLAEALSDWQPATATEGQAMLNRMAALYDDFQMAAGNNGLDDLYRSIADLAAKSLQDLSEKSAVLPDSVTITRNRPVPALVLGQQLYADAGRSDELMQRASAPHPAFMPLSFEGKSA